MEVSKYCTFGAIYIYVDLKLIFGVSFWKQNSSFSICQKDRWANFQSKGSLNNFKLLLFFVVKGSTCHEEIAYSSSCFLCFSILICSFVVLFLLSFHQHHALLTNKVSNSNSGLMLQHHHCRDCFRRTSTNWPEIFVARCPSAAFSWSVNRPRIVLKNTL